MNKQKRTLTFQKRLILLGVLCGVAISAFAIALISGNLSRKNELENLHYVGEVSLVVGEAYCALNNNRHTLTGYIRYAEKEPSSEFGQQRIDIYLQELEMLEKTLVKLDALVAQKHQKNLGEATLEDIGKLEESLASIRTLSSEIVSMVYKTSGDPRSKAEELQEELLDFIASSGRRSENAQFSKNLVALQGFLSAKRELWKLRGGTFSRIANNKEEAITTIAGYGMSHNLMRFQTIAAFARKTGTEASIRFLDSFFDSPEVTAYIEAAEFVVARNNMELLEGEAAVALYKDVQPFRAAVEDSYYKLSPLVLETNSKLCNAIGDRLEEEIEEAQSAAWQLIIFTLVGLVLLTAAFTLVVRSTIIKIRGNSLRLATSSERSALAAEHLRSASDKLAAHASEEASTNEQVCSNLSNLSELSQSNTSKLEEAKGTVIDAMERAREGSAAMSEMNEAMHAIETSSNDISQIIGSIEEIAFQTNILALNAAIEAARAGEAGAGFSVVAEQVRELAKRSSKAAGETKERIANALQNSQQGMQMTTKATHELDQIVAKIEKVKDSTEEIATAVCQQTRGIDSMNQSMEELSRATRELAANSEENAAAAMEMTSITDTIEACSIELNDFLGQANANGPGSRSPVPATSANRRPSKPPFESAPRNDALSAEFFN